MNWWNGQARASAREAASIQHIQTYWTDSTDILNELDLYEAFWIKPHGCVWSECTVDDTDDSVTGDNRDGDSEWYQYRTQAFCANAAYELYGRLKDESVMGQLFQCSRGHYINSFFTYGGADNLLTAIGETPIVYYVDVVDGDGNNNNNNADDSYVVGNDMCVNIEYTGTAASNNKDDNEEGGSGSQDQGEGDFSSSLGCNSEGSYIVAAFESASCDGNYFLESLDDFEEYNAQHSNLGCHKIYHNDEFGLDDITTLLLNSWSCDVNLYPNGCPDTFGVKERQDFALQTAANRGNANMAYRNISARRPLQVTTIIFLVLALCILGFAYFVKNHARIGAKGKGIRGYFRCVGEDLKLFLISCLRIIQARLRRTQLIRGSKDPSAVDADTTMAAEFSVTEADGYRLSEELEAPTDAQDPSSMTHPNHYVSMEGKVEQSPPAASQKDPSDSPAKDPSDSPIDEKDVDEKRAIESSLLSEEPVDGGKVPDTEMSSNDEIAPNSGIEKEEPTTSDENPAPLDDSAAEGEVPVTTGVLA